ncbi:type II secretion system F family protein [Motilimonas pumila]|uniref:Type II secretion system F family protein n=1 Tax=Motilimonas pumila TaxID=2303987 RepID=A0A418YAI1_9GAMM|nr:type II secretion system F family protein [Motilimonas pumila]RJG39518.1 type II secretion system F family protein [Motilimonas pumila]
MSTEIIILSCLLTLVVVLFFYSIKRISDDTPEDNREFLDPLPKALKPIWPLVRVVAHLVGERLPVDDLETYSRMLRRSGLDFLFTPEQFFSLQMLSSICFSIICWLCLLMLDAEGALPIVFAGFFGWVFPRISLGDIRKKREQQIIRHLPVYLDFIVMSVEAGLNLSGGITQAVKKGPSGPLKFEFRRVLRDIKAGKPKLESLREMEVRLNIKEITNLVNSLIQAERSGSSMGETLRIQAEQRRVERFQRAEKLALQAPVKLIFPLIAFVFPVTFAVLAFPIAMKLLYEM